MDPYAALAEPTRRRLLDALLDGAKPVNALVQSLGTSQPVVSRHLRILRDCGLVRVRPDGQRRLYSINAQPLAQIDAWIQPYRELWSARLDALERHLDNANEESQQ